MLVFCYLWLSLIRSRWYVYRLFWLVKDHIFLKCGWDVTTAIVGITDRILNFASRDIWTILFGTGQIFKKHLDFLVFCLWWSSLCRYSNSDIRYEFPWKFDIWRYLYISCGEGQKTGILAVICLLWSKLTWYSHSDTRSWFPKNFAFREHLNHYIWWGPYFQKHQNFYRSLSFMA